MTIGLHDGVPKRQLLSALSVTPAALLIALSSALTMLSGCASPDPDYYSLAPRGHVASIAHSRAGTSTAMYIEVQQVHVPERLNRPQIVTLGAKTNADVQDMKRWTSPFPDEFRDALSQRLQHLLGAVDLYQQSGTEALPRYRINIDVVQFDALPEATHARIAWTIRGTVNDAVHSGITQVTLPSSGSIDDVVTTGQAVVQQVASDIAGQLSTQPD